MKLLTVAKSFGHVPIGTKVYLTREQASARAHQLKVLKEPGKSEESRGFYLAEAALGFKSGEELAVDGKLDRGLEMLFGIDPISLADAADRASTKVETPQTRAARDESRKKKAAAAAIDKARAEVDDATAKLDEAEKAEKAAPAEGKAAAKASSDAAREALAAAKGNLKELTSK